MKKSLRAGMALTSLVFAAGLVFSGCLAISDGESEEAKTTSEISAGSLNRAAVSYSGTSGILGSITSATPTGSGLTGVKAQGWLNSTYIVWTGSSSSYTVTCDGQAVSSYLTRKIGGQWRCDIPGLAKGNHTIKVTSGSSYLSATVSVASHDRTGFAFYGAITPGAYKADGTLKDNAVVLYVNESTKDKVSLDVVTSSKGATTTCTGLQNILNAFKKGYDNRPLCVRLIGKVTDFATMDNGDIMISGSSASKPLSNGLTIEGIGSDATAYGWGIRIKNAQYVEISNIGFMMVDSAEGDNVSLQQSNKNVWVHNCDMFYGAPGGDADQKKGDGALDCKKSTYVTFSYNHFWDSGKCNLLGLSEGTTSDLYITYHHNWYDHSDSRHPRCRYYSAHIYNNYYDGNSKYGAGACLGSSLFMESNYFRNCKYPMMISMQGTDLFAGTSSKNSANSTFSKEAGGMIKAYNNTMTGTYYFIPYGGTYSGADTTSDFDAYVVSSKSATVPSSVVSLSGSNKYNNFDTSSIMYSYTADSPEDAVKNVKKYAGRIEGGDFTYTFPDSVDKSYDVDTTLKSKLENYTGATTAYNEASSSESSGGSSSGESSGSSSGSSSSLSISASKTQTGVGTRSRLNEISSINQIKNAISVSNTTQLKAALNEVVSGGAIVLEKGTYSFSETITISSSNNGSSSAMKYIIAAPGTSAEDIILDFSSQSLSDFNRGIHLFGSYWHFYGLTIKGAGDNGLYVSGKNNIIENCIFVENRDSGLQIAREKSSLSNMSDWPSNNLILNCTSYNNADKTGENADGFACKLTAGNGNVFDGCISYSNSDDGWDLYAKEATGSIGVVTIKNCVAFNNGKLTTGSSYGNGDMNGFKLGGSNGKVPTAHIVSNCIAFANGHDGFTDNGNGGSLSLTNCTSYNNAKVNFNFYRTNKGNFTGLVTGSPNNSDKYGTSSVASTVSKTLYYTNSKYYWISSATSVTNGQKNVGTQVNAPSFKSTSLPTANSSVHKNLRNADGTVKLGDMLKPNDSTYSGARFSTQAASILGVSLKTN